LKLNWWNFAAYPVDELSSTPSFNQSPQHRKNRFLTEERAIFDQVNFKTYTLAVLKRSMALPPRSAKVSKEMRALAFSISDQVYYQYPL
jgi:hypothetical protein